MPPRIPYKSLFSRLPTCRTCFGAVRTPFPTLNASRRVDSIRTFNASAVRLQATKVIQTESFSSRLKSAENALERIASLKDWDAVEDEKDALSQTLANELWDQAPAKAAEISRQIAALESLVEARRSMSDELRDLAELWMLARSDNDMATLESTLNEVGELDEEANALYQNLLFPSGEDKFHAIVEINAGEGGLGSQQFLWMVAEMYRKWASNHGWPVFVLDEIGVGQRRAAK